MGLNDGNFMEGSGIFVLSVYVGRENFLGVFSQYPVSRLSLEVETN